MRRVIEAAYRKVDRMIPQANGYEGSGPWWFGWAIREAFIAGARWKSRALKSAESPATVRRGRPRNKRKSEMPLYGTIYGDRSCSAGTSPVA
jgi:hypothetical protein